MFCVFITDQNITWKLIFRQNSEICCYLDTEVYYSTLLLAANFQTISTANPVKFFTNTANILRKFWNGANIIRVNIIKINLLIP